MTTRTTRTTPNTPPGPARITDRPAGGDATLERARRLLRDARALPDLPPELEARIDRRVATLWRSAAGRRLRWPALAAGATVLLLGGAVAAKYGPAPLRRLLAALHTTTHETPRVAPHAPPRPPAPVVVPLAPPPPVATIEPAPPALAPRGPAPGPRTRREGATRHERHRRTALRSAAAPASHASHAPAKAPRPPAPTPAPSAAPAPTAPAAPVATTAPPSALGGESLLLGRALAQLRHEGDPAGALATLDEYDARFPRGVMAFDGLAARVETLVALGRKQEAVSRLDAVPGRTLAKSPALRLLRGELRASVGRYDDAIADFDRQLGNGAAHGDLHERALHGRGSSRALAGDTRGAREDLELYLRLYPRGRFAAEARQVLGR
jgi:hypothetical protein